MRALERFKEFRKQKIKFSLNARMTLLAGAVVLVSVLFAFGVSALLQFLIPAIAKIPTLIQLAVLSLVVSLVASYFLSKLFVSPIKELREGMQKVADGNFSTQLETKSSSLEIQQVFAGFNMMTQELNSTEILQSDFVSNVSHEFKTPINAIEGYTTLLQSCENLDGDQQEYVNKILYNTQRLSSLVSNILLLSKIENQSLQIHKEEFALDEQVREAILSLENEWTKKNIELDVEMDDITFFGSENMLRHVWTNLIGNAIKFTPQDSKVIIRLKKEPDCIKFTVEDEGEGLSEAAQKHIFDKFYQGDTSHKSEGNGLGLALVKRILAIEGGDVFAENLNVGCRFTVILK